MNYYCSDHKTYTGKRIPRRSCYSCWKIYCEVHELSVKEVINRPHISEARASWLRENIDDIVSAPLEESILQAPPKMPERASASFITEAEIVEEPEEGKPVRGTKV